MGFSAGAHVALMLANLWNNPVSREGTDIPEGGNKPNATVTGYSPTTFENFFEVSPSSLYEPYGSISAGPINLINRNHPFFKRISDLTVTNYISEKTPPAFLWKTTSDSPVSSIEYFEKLSKLSIDCELHIFNDEQRTAALEFDEKYSTGRHPERKYSLNTGTWPVLAVNWLNKIYKNEEQN